MVCIVCAVCCVYVLLVSGEIGLGYKKGKKRSRTTTREVKYGGEKKLVRCKKIVREFIFKITS